MFMDNSSRVVLALLTFLIVSCGFTPFYASGKRFDTDRVAEIVEHQTTRDDIFQMFGEPFQMDSANAEQASWWRYEYTYLRFSTTERATLQIFFADDRVDKFRLKIEHQRY